jgi:hypothetical protein
MSATALAGDRGGLRINESRAEVNITDGGFSPCQC